MRLKSLGSDVISIVMSMFVGGCALSSSMFRIYLEKVVIVELDFYLMSVSERTKSQRES
jgi:hypothetical protein